MRSRVCDEDYTTTHHSGHPHTFSDLQRLMLLYIQIYFGWEEELEKMNEGKVGEPYHYPESFVQLLGYMRAYFHLAYHQTEGVVVKAHARKVPIHS